MPSAFWYYGLAVISVMLVAASLAHKRNLKLLVLHLAMAGIIHPFEVMVLFVLVGYRYLPGLLPEATFDNGLGAFVSDLFIVPASAVAINAFSLPWGAIAGIAAALTATDWLYAKIGIYQHFWWKSVYTGAGLLVYYAISRWMWRGLGEERTRPCFRLAVIYLAYAILHSFMAFIAAGLLRLYRFEIPWLAEPARNHPALPSLLLYLTAAIVTLCIGLELRFRYRLAGLALLAAINWAIGYYDIFVPLAGLPSHYLIVIPAITVSILFVLFRAAGLEWLFPQRSRRI